MFLSPLLHRLLAGSLLSLCGQAFARGLGFAAYVAVARILGAEDFGRYGALQATVIFFAAIASLGLSATATRFIAVAWRTRPARCGRLVGLLAGLSCLSGITMTLLTLATAPLVAAHGLHEPGLATQIAILSGVVSAQAVLGCLQGILVGMERFADNARASILAAILVAALVPLGGYAAGLVGTSLGLVVANLLATAYAWWLVVRALRSRGLRPELRRGRRLLRPILAYGLPLYIATLANGPFNWLCTAILAAEPGGMRQIGLYTAAHQIFLALLYLPMVIGSAAQPMATAAYAGGDRAGLRRILAWYLLTTLALVLPAVAVVLLAPAWILGLFRPEFAASGDILVPLGLTVLVASGKSLLGLISRLGPLVRLEMWSCLIGGAVLVLWTWVHRQDGASGLAWARLASILAEAGFAAPLVFLFMRRLAARPA